MKPQTPARADLPIRLRLRRLLLAALAPVFGSVFTGCVSVRVHTVHKTIVAPHVLDATLDQLIAQMNTRYTALQTINASVEITATTGGEHEGEVKEIPSFAGYIFLRKPSDLRVLLLLPVIRSRALDMVSDGKTFTLLIPPKSRAVMGSDLIVEAPETLKAPEAPAVAPAAVAPGTAPASAEHQPSSLESLRPNIIRDALQVPALAPDEFVTLTQHSRILAPGASETRLARNRLKSRISTSPSCAGSAGRLSRRRFKRWRRCA